LQAVQAKLAKVRVQSEVAVERYDEATGKLGAVQAQIGRNQHLLKLAEYQLAVANTQLQVRAREMYMSQDVGIMDVLFSSRTFDDLVTQIDAMRRIGDSDAVVVSAAAADRQQVDDRRVALQASKKAAESLVAQRETSKNEVFALQSQLNSTAGGLKNEIAQLEKQQAAAAARAARAAAQAAAAATAAQVASAAQPVGSGSSGSASVSPAASGGGGGGHPSVVSIARRYLGVPYVWGGASPRGFDCSGLAMYCYAQVGVSLSHGATDQQRASNPVSLNNLQPGDLVFFGSAAFSHHVGIYVGGGQMIDAPYTGAVVRYDSIAGAWIGGRF